MESGQSSEVHTDSKHTNTDSLINEPVSAVLIHPEPATAAEPMESSELTAEPMESSELPITSTPIARRTRSKTK